MSFAIGSIFSMKTVIISNSLNHSVYTKMSASFHDRSFLLHGSMGSKQSTNIPSQSLPTVLETIKIKEMKQILKKWDVATKLEVNHHITRNYHLQDWVIDENLAYQELVMRLFSDLLMQRVRLKDTRNGFWITRSNRDLNHRLRLVLLIICIKKSSVTVEKMQKIDWLGWRNKETYKNDSIDSLDV